MYSICDRVICLGFAFQGRRGRNIRLALSLRFYYASPSFKMLSKNMTRSFLFANRIFPFCQKPVKSILLFFFAPPLAYREQIHPSFSAGTSSASFQDIKLIDGSVFPIWIPVLPADRTEVRTDAGKHPSFPWNLLQIQRAVSGLPPVFSPNPDST